MTSGLDFESLPQDAGTHMAPEDFNALIDEPGVRLIDVRNSYEIGIGTFTEAVNPQIENFVDFPGLWSRNWIRKTCLRPSPCVARAEYAVNAPPNIS